jgi:lipopolysaccharide export system ATP-binding protein
VTEPRLDQIVARLGAADVSTLIALRALVEADDGVDAVDRARWMTAVREEYGRWYGNGQAPENFADPETQRYLEEHVVRNLWDGGAVELLDADGHPLQTGNGGGSWSAVRLTPGAMPDGNRRGEVLGVMDARIRAILHAARPASEPAVHAVDGDEREHGAAVRVDDGREHEAGAGVVEAERPHHPDPWETEAAEIFADREDQAEVAEPAEAPRAAATERRPMLVAGGQTLAARGLVKTYRGRRVVNEVDIHVSQGEIVGLLGPNGAGKTTSFYMIVGLIRPDRGKVFIGSRELTRVPMYKRARAGIGYLAQEPSIFRKLTVEENVMAILQMMRIPRAERKKRLEGLLDELSIKHLRKTRAYALSGGERRRLEITRALVSQPKFMLLDEPFAGVDPIAVHDIQQIVSDLRRRGIGVLISDHNVEQTLDIVDRAYIMYEGKVRVSGTVEELVWNDEVAEIYLGPTLTARMRERYSNPQGDDAV